MRRFTRAAVSFAGVVVFGALAAAQEPAPVVPLDPPGELIPVQGGVTSPLAEPNIMGTARDPGIPDAPGQLDWKKIPRVQPLPRPGIFSVPPTGPGYYSILDRIRGIERKGPPKWPYPRTAAAPQAFFDLDNFSYLDDPKNTEFDWSDPLHRVRRGDWLFVTGGEIRSRYETRYNDALFQLNNDYTLSRVRTYGDLWYRDDFRVFAEYIGAWVSGPELDPVYRDENKADFLNLFLDLKVAEWGGEPAYVRVGRQELILGSQRHVSSIDWANARRPFQGVRGFRHTEKWDADLFWAQPVFIQPNKLDSVENNLNFAGAFTEYRPKKGQAVDAYYYMLDNTNRIVQRGITTAPFTRHTFGGRYAGNEGDFLFDAEAAMQLGTADRRNVIAGMATTGAGWNFKDAPWYPTVWAYYDYASGGGATGTGTVHTYNQLFQFGHYYFGWLDYVGRQNIHDLNFHLYLYPAKWLTTWVQFHSFWLDSPTDALYNAAGAAIRRDPTGQAGRHVGEEIDVVWNFHATQHLDFFLGYSHLFGGEFLKNTAGKDGAVNANFFWFQTTYRW